MTTTPEREEFEAWLLDEQWLTATWNEARNCYDEFPAHLALKAWQAAMKAASANIASIQSARDFAAKAALENEQARAAAARQSAPERDAERLDWCISVLFDAGKDCCFLTTHTGCGCCAETKRFEGGTSGREAIDAARLSP